LTEKGRALRAKASQIPSCVFSAAGGNTEDLTKELTQLRMTLGLEGLIRPDSTICAIIKTPAMRLTDLFD
jgi:hypothetical protein